MAKAPITKRYVDSAQPSGSEYVVWDDGGKETIKGFGLKVTPAGAKVYLYQYRIARPGKAAQTTPRKYTIGRHGDLTPDQARSRARELAAMVSQGIDPRQRELDALAAEDDSRQRAAEKARIEGELTFEKVADRWLEEYELRRRPRSHDQAKLTVNKHLMPTLKGKPLPSITRGDLQTILDGIPARQPATRRTVYAYASILFGWAVKRGEIAENPLSKMSKPEAAKARDRVLSDEEVRTIWEATMDLPSPLGAFYRVLLLTGQRREEVAGMAWSEIDRASATWVIPASRAKNGSAHIVPLTPAVIEEIDRLALTRQVKTKDPRPDAARWPKLGAVIAARGGVSLNSFSRSKRLLDAKITELRKEKEADATAPWRVHDLRRTMATGFQRLGIRYEVTEAVLNHVSGARSGVAGIYQRHDWREEKRAALDAWARHVAAIIAQTDETNVIPIGGAQRVAS